MHCLQQQYGLADKALEGALYDRQGLNDFAGIDRSPASVPNATTLLKSRRPVLDNDLTRTPFEQINAHRAEHGLLIGSGSIVTRPLLLHRAQRNTRPAPEAQRFSLFGLANLVIFRGSLLAAHAQGTPSILRIAFEKA